MRLNVSTDYALRVLLYLTLSGDRFVPAREIAESFEVSLEHVRKITKDLTARGWLESRRGREGGVRLAVSPQELELGAVVAALEPLDLVECFRPGTNACRLAPGCALQRALEQATRAFLAALDDYTLADLARGKKLRRLLDLHP